MSACAKLIAPHVIVVRCNTGAVFHVSDDASTTAILLMHALPTCVHSRCTSSLHVMT